MLFAAQGCQVICFMSNNEYTNFYMYDQLAKQLNHTMTLIAGDEAPNSHMYSIHNDYIISINLLEQTLEKINATQQTCQEAI